MNTVTSFDTLEVRCLMDFVLVSSRYEQNLKLPMLVIGNRSDKHGLIGFKVHSALLVGRQLGGRLKCVVAK